MCNKNPRIRTQNQLSGLSRFLLTALLPHGSIEPTLTTVVSFANAHALKICVKRVDNQIRPVKKHNNLTSKYPPDSLYGCHLGCQKKKEKKEGGEGGIKNGKKKIFCCKKTKMSAWSNFISCICQRIFSILVNFGLNVCPKFFCFNNSYANLFFCVRRVCGQKINFQHKKNFQNSQNF